MADATSMKGNTRQERAQRQEQERLAREAAQKPPAPAPAPPKKDGKAKRAKD